MYPFYNPQFVKLEHEGRIAQIPGAEQRRQAPAEITHVPVGGDTQFGGRETRPVRFNQLSPPGWVRGTLAPMPVAMS